MRGLDRILQRHGAFLGFALAWGLGAVAGHAVEAPTNATVRVTVTLPGGGVVQGTLDDAPVALRAPYADLEITTRWLQVLQRDRSGSVVQVLTVDNSRITAFLQTENFLLRTNSTADPVAIGRWSFERITRAEIPEALTNTPQHWVRLRNGDLLGGAFPEQTLTIHSGGDTLRLAVRDMAAWKTRANAPEAELTLRDGRTVPGLLADARLAFQLACGPVVQLAPEDIASVGGTPDDSSPRNATGPVTSVTNYFPNLVWIAPGEFLMGSAPEEIGRDSDEGPQTRVIIAGGFYLGRHEVTQGEYQAVMGVNPSINAGNPQRPIEKLSWYEAMEFCERLTRQADQAGTLPQGWEFRLPTEAEWEYACRAGTTARFSYGDDKSELQLGDFAWFTRNSDSMTHPVGQKKPNAWGLHDMHGNVWEWCLDRWGGLLPGGTITNRAAAATGSLRAARGGSWLYEARSCRSANRDDYSASNRCGDVGLRLVLARVGI